MSFFKISTIVFALCFISACSSSNSESVMQAQKPQCIKDTVCPEVAIKKKNDKYNIFVSIPDTSMSIQSVGFKADNSITKYEVDSAQVERSVTGENTFLIMNVDEGFLNSIIKANNSEILITTDKSTINGVIKAHNIKSGLYSAMANFLN